MPFRVPPACGGGGCGAARLPVRSFGSCRVSAARVPQRPVHRRHWPQEAPPRTHLGPADSRPQCLSQPVPQAAASGPVRALPLGFHTTCSQLGGGSCSPWRPTPAGATLYMHCLHCPWGPSTAVLGGRAHLALEKRKALPGLLTSRAPVPRPPWAPPVSLCASLGSMSAGPAAVGLGRGLTQREGGRLLLSHLSLCSVETHGVEVLGACAEGRLW